LPAWVKYLLAFDVKYRIRRMHFLITGQNRLYQLIDQDRFAGLNPFVVDRLKREFYRRLDELRRRETADFTAARRVSWPPTSFRPHLPPRRSSIWRPMRPNSWSSTSTSSID